MSYRLQDMETQYRKEKEEADLLLEQHRLVGSCAHQYKAESHFVIDFVKLISVFVFVFSTQTVTAAMTLTNAPVRRAGG